MKVFISHSSKDRDIVERDVVAPLTAAGVNVWYSRVAIQSAAEWERSILAALEECTHFVLVMSPHSADSEWVRDELTWAIDHRAGMIVPVRIANCREQDFHIRIRRIQVIDLRSPHHNGSALVEAFLRTKEERTRWKDQQQQAAAGELRRRAVLDAQKAESSPDRILMSRSHESRAKGVLTVAIGIVGAIAMMAVGKHLVEQIVGVTHADVDAGLHPGATPLPSPSPTVAASPTSGARTSSQAATSTPTARALPSISPRKNCTKKPPTCSNWNASTCACSKCLDIVNIEFGAFGLSDAVMLCQKMARAPYTIKIHDPPQHEDANSSWIVVLRRTTLGHRIPLQKYESARVSERSILFYPANGGLTYGDFEVVVGNTGPLRANQRSKMMISVAPSEAGQ